MKQKILIITLWLFLIPLGIVGATAVVFFHNTLYIAFNFIIILIIAAVVVFCLKAEFLAYIILIVYIGAIAILFLFVIMMLNLNLASVAILSTWELCIAFFLLLKILLVLVTMLIPNIVSCLGKCVAWPTFWHIDADRSVNALDFKDLNPPGCVNWTYAYVSKFTTSITHNRFLEAGYAEKSLLSKASPLQIENLGHLLYIDFYYLFLMVGIVLLVAMVGGLVLTTSRNLKKNEYRI
jgi:NADH:ubiquinone oxidoreductase subunit 6 (subunit J)